MKTVMHLLSSNKLSGAENIALETIFLTRKKYTNFYVSLNGPIADTLNERGVKYYLIDKMSIKNIKKAFSALKPDIIHAYDMKASVFASKFSKKSKIISHIHNNNFDSRRVSLKSVLFLIASKRIHHIFWITQNALNDYKFSKFVKNKSSVLYNFVNVDKILSLSKSNNSKGKFDLVFLGRLEDVKNPIEFIKIISDITKKGKTIKACMIGDGSLKDKCMSYINECQMENSITMVGFLKNPYQILSKAKLLIMTSKTEGMPMSILESFALGVPVVSTKVGGIPEIISNDKNGFATNDSLKMREKICEYLEDDTFRSTLSFNAKNDALTIYDSNKFMEELTQYYDN